MTQTALHRGSTAMAERLARFLAPRSVAIVGASDRPGALGASVLANLDRANFDGAIHLVNPRRDTIAGRPCVATVGDLPQGIDVAVLAIPRDGVVEAVRGLAERGTQGVVIFSAGFAEDGERGAADQQEIASIARAAEMIVEGPNCLGLVNFRQNIPLTFIEMPPTRAEGDRRVGIVSQSGAMAAVLATTMIAREVPLSCYVSTGNEAVTGVEDFVAHLVDDPHTVVIGMIVEHFRQPQRFLAVARAARAAGKPVVLLHPGRSAAAAASAATHTGAMAGDHAVMRTLVRDAGVILVQSLEELGDVVEIVSRGSALAGKATGIVAESGAFKAMMLDLADATGLHLPRLTDADSPALRAALPAFVPVSNPLDVTAQGLVDPGLYGRTIAALVDDARIDTIVVTLIQTDISTSSIKFAAVADALREAGDRKPVIVAGVDEGGGVAQSDIAALRSLGATFLPTAERALRALARIAAPRGKDAPDSAGKEQHPPLVVDLPGAGSIVPEYRSKALLGEAGIAFPDYELATTAQDAVRAADRLGYPVVLKAQAADLPHKSDAGGVVVGLADAAAVEAGWARLVKQVAAARPELVLDGVLVERMADRGVELIVGGRNDPAWGPVVLVGSGGVAAELLHDVRLLPPGLSEAAIIDELRALKLGALLTGFRGSAPADIAAVARLVRRLGAVLRDNPTICEIDLNPVVVYPEGGGALALDALISM